MANNWKVFWAASFALVVFFQACGVHMEEWIVSIDDEKKMGREFDSLVKRGDPSVMSNSSTNPESLFCQGGNCDGAALELYNFYQERGRKLVSVIDSKDWKSILPSAKLCGNKVTCTKDNFFEFNIIKSKTVNAFAVPGGYVYFYTAILKNFRSESELMSVLGHEVGHVILHHSRDRMVKQAGAATVIEVFLGSGIAGLIGTLGANFWLMGNSQDNESESDSMGFYYTNKIGISSAGLSDFFGRGLHDPTGANCSKDNSVVLDAFSTHPPSCERVKANNKRISDSHQNFPKDITTVNGKNFTQLVSAAGL